MKKFKNARVAMLSIIRYHPDGLQAGQVRIKVKEAYATCPGYIPMLLSIMKEEGKVKRLAKSPCECCGHPMYRYKITAEGEAYLKLKLSHSPQSPHPICGPQGLRAPLGEL